MGIGQPCRDLRCLNLLTRIIYLIQQGEKFTPQDRTKARTKISEYGQTL